MTEKYITRIVLLAAIIFTVSRVPNGLQAEPPVATMEEAVLTNPAIGEVRLFAGNFAPRGWAKCEGQLLAISQNTALFSILGTTYGGDGRTTFALPDLRGRTVLGTGTGPGLSPVQLGQKLGTSSTTVNIAPTAPVAGSGGTAAPPPPRNATGNAGMTGVSASSQPETTVTPPPSTQTIDLHQPSFGLNYIIALQGIYPSRN